MEDDDWDDDDGFADILSQFRLKTILAHKLLYLI